MIHNFLKAEMCLSEVVGSTGYDSQRGPVLCKHALGSATPRQPGPMTADGPSLWASGEGCLSSLQHF